jgi:SAM-dependent methyltransferase
VEYLEICDYSGIAKDYEHWSSGDKAFYTSAAFYLDYLEEYSGVFAEIGVGTGRIALPLSQRVGNFVYGVDMCKDMLDQCMSKKSNMQNFEPVHSDFLRFNLPQKANIIYMPFRTIGHIMTKNDLIIFFCNTKNNLAKDGLFIFDHYMFDKVWALDHNRIDIPMFDGGDVKITDYYEYDFDKGIMNCHIKRNNEVVTQFMFRWIEVEEIREVFNSIGFKCIALYGDFDKSPWTSRAKNQIWILRSDSQ